MPKYVHYVRKFLNKPKFESTAAILTTISVEPAWHSKNDKNQRTSSIDAEYTLTDCSRKVSLSFYGGDVSVSPDGKISAKDLQSVSNLEFKAMTLKNETVAFCDRVLYELAGIREEADSIALLARLEKKYPKKDADAEA